MNLEWKPTHRKPNGIISNPLSCRYLRNMAMMPPATIAHIVREDVFLNLREISARDEMSLRSRAIELAHCTSWHIAQAALLRNLFQRIDSANRRGVATVLAAAIPKGLDSMQYLSFQSLMLRKEDLISVNGVQTCSRNAPEVLTLLLS